MKFGSFKQVLTISAHPDDAELGCAGTVARAIEAGARVDACLMTTCADEAPRGRKTLRADEFLHATKVLGIRKTHVFDLPNRDLPAHATDMMDRFADLQDSIQPDLVLVPWSEDSHQDHSAVALAAIRSFRRRETILQYEILRYGSHSFTPNLFIDITDVLDLKMKVLACYKSQAERRSYFDDESFRGLARTRGAQIGYDYAEGFLIYKMLW